VKRLLFLAMLGLTGIAPAAFATTGGPEVAEVLGWNPNTRVAYFAIRFQDDSGRNSRVVAIPLTGERRGKSLVLDWSRTDQPISPQYARSMAALQRRLVPLKAVSAPAFDFRPHVLRADSVRLGEDRIPRFRLRSGGIECVAYCSTHFAIVREFRVPGRAERFGIAAFRGIPYEACYETQIPFLFPDPGVIRVLEPNPQ